MTRYEAVKIIQEVRQMEADYRRIMTRAAALEEQLSFVSDGEQLRFEMEDGIMLGSCYRTLQSLLLSDTTDLMG